MRRRTNILLVEFYGKGLRNRIVVFQLIEVGADEYKIKRGRKVVKVCSQREASREFAALWKSRGL
jgi:hypothetical protein